MKHLGVLHDPCRTGDTVVDARARLDTTAFPALWPLQPASYPSRQLP